jgi:hypothetical protein
MTVWIILICLYDLYTVYTIQTVECLEISTRDGTEKIVVECRRRPAWLQTENCSWFHVIHQAAPRVRFQSSSALESFSLRSAHTWLNRWLYAQQFSFVVIATTVISGM